ncbi:hypothetical protein LCGC14_1612360 [marine sediment metagenome]|uniref:Uncharacterized protein n=1 Tax=marine sediment metagenome TaxID=412755 RepID=A0A0F9IUM9_9ZZZZ
MKTQEILNEAAPLFTKDELDMLVEALDFWSNVGREGDDVYGGMDDDFVDSILFSAGDKLTKLLRRAEVGHKRQEHK